MARIAVVTGGTQGIGLATSRALAEEGVQVIILDNKPNADQLSEKLGFEVRACDVQDYEQCAAVVDAVEKELGRIDILVNNAGVTRDAMLHKMSFEQWDQVIRIDLYGVFNMTRSVVSGMRARGFGRIINISSVNAQKGQAGQSNYCAAKAGIIGFTKAVAQECARKGGTVNAIAPGYVDTSLVRAMPADILRAIETSTPMGRLATPDEIARSVVFLASDKAGFITGATWAVNGGLYMSG